jgi:predicted nucleic acid-binding protein
MPFVVDASVALCWLMPDERDPIALAAYARIGHDTADVPALFWFELCNALVVNERRGRLDPAMTGEALRLLKRLPITVEADIGEDLLLRVVRTHRLTVYDAAYLEIALRRGLVLATLDDALARAARAEKVALMPAGATG